MQMQAFGFDSSFEAVLVHSVITDPRRYAQIGFALEPDALSAPSAKILMKAAHDIYAETKAPPSSDIMLFQRMARWRHEGRLSMEDGEEAVAYLDMPSRQKFPVDQIIAEAVPVVKRAAQAGMLEKAFSQYGKAGIDTSKLRQQLDQIERIGQQAIVSAGVNSLSGLIMAAKDRFRLRVTTGNRKLDMLYGGGLPRPALSMFGGSTGDGKTNILLQIAAANMHMGLHVGICTNEMIRQDASSMLLAALARVSRTMCDQGDDRAMAECNRRLAAKAFRFSLEYFEPSTPWSVYSQWIDARQADHGPFDVVIFDYLDRIGVDGQPDCTEFLQGKIVTEAMRAKALREGWAAVSGVQLQRKERKKGAYAEEMNGVFDGSWMADEQNIAGSIHKPRIADTVATLNINKLFNAADPKLVALPAGAEQNASNSARAIFKAKDRYGISRIGMYCNEDNFAYGTWLPIDAVGFNEPGWNGYDQLLYPQ